MSSREPASRRVMWGEIEQAPGRKTASALEFACGSPVGFEDRSNTKLFKVHVHNRLYIWKRWKKFVRASELTIFIEKSHRLKS